MRSILSLVLIAALGGTSRGESGDPAATRVYHAARPGSIAEAQRRLAAGDREIQSAVDSLVARADDLLDVRPPTVTAKRRPAPSGDPHDGSQPHELVRTKSLGYSRFNLEALCQLATLAEHAGIDLWHFETHDGRSIRRAIDFLLPYVTAPHRWPHEQISRLDQADFATILWQAGIVYRDPSYSTLVDGFAGDRDGWIRLTFVDE